MAFELKFSKPNSSVHWGFRLVGGVDFDQPLVVVKVNENSLAEEAGLQVGDVVVRINDTSTAGLTHTEAHDLLVSAGLQFVVGIRRGEFNTQIGHDEDYDFEFSKLVKDLEESVNEDIINEAVERINNLSVQGNREQYRTTEDSSIENLAGQEEMVYAGTQPLPIDSCSKSIAHGIKKDKKWSTFLVKPETPVLKSRQRIEEENAQTNSYKVEIKKQGRRPVVVPQKKVQFDQYVTEVVQLPLHNEEDTCIEGENTYDNESENIACRDTDIGSDIPDETLATTDEVDQSDGYESDECNNNYEVEEDFESQTSGESMNVKFKPLSEIRVDESSLSLEEQLRAVQRQLQALSQLPSAIQLTLDAVSKQLADIVSTKSSEEREIDGKLGDVTEETEEEMKEEGQMTSDCSTSQKAEAETVQDDLEDLNSVVGDELEDDNCSEIQVTMYEVEAEEECDSHISDGLTEEEQQTIIEEEQRVAKKDKEMEERPRPYQRPIILPGGRRWSNPDDTIPKFKKPKLSEEKILETIENNLEVIKGNRKGINFLKYTPPTKNLDYLQRSEVYRLIHDVEPPAVKGIVSRPEKILALQDYYEATQAEP